VGAEADIKGGLWTSSLPWIAPTDAAVGAATPQLCGTPRIETPAAYFLGSKTLEIRAASGAMKFWESPQRYREADHNRAYHRPDCSFNSTQMVLALVPHEEHQSNVAQTIARRMSVRVRLNCSRIVIADDGTRARTLVRPTNSW
jgi:hypothetical protein